MKLPKLGNGNGGDDAGPRPKSYWDEERDRLRERQALDSVETRLAVAEHDILRMRQDVHHHGNWLMKLNAHKAQVTTVVVTVAAVVSVLAWLFERMMD